MLYKKYTFHITLRYNIRMINLKEKLVAKPNSSRTKYGSSYLSSDKTSPPFGQRALETMIRQNVVERIKRGRYIATRGDQGRANPLTAYPEIIPELLLMGLDVRHYLSFHSALWHHGLLEQQSRTLFVAVDKQQRNFSHNQTIIKFIRLRKDSFFGYEIEKIEGQDVHVASVEKALLDSLKYPQYVGPYPVVLNAIYTAWTLGTLNPETLVNYALRVGSPFLNRRLGYIMESFAIKGYEPLQKELGRTYATTLRGEPYSRKADTFVNHKWRILEEPETIYLARNLK